MEQQEKHLQSKMVIYDVHRSSLIACLRLHEQGEDTLLSVQELRYFTTSSRIGQEKHDKTFRDILEQDGMISSVLC